MLCVSASIWWCKHKTASFPYPCRQCLHYLRSFSFLFFSFLIKSLLRVKLVPSPQTNNWSLLYIVQIYLFDLFTPSLWRNLHALWCSFACVRGSNLNFLGVLYDLQWAHLNLQRVAFFKFYPSPCFLPWPSHLSAKCKHFFRLSLTN